MTNELEKKFFDAFGIGPYYKYLLIDKTSRFHNEKLFDKTNFIDMPLNYQVDGLINELRSNKFKNKLSKVKSSKTSVNACDLWTKHIEGVSPDDAHRKWINKSRTEYKSAFE